MASGYDMNSSHYGYLHKTYTRPSQPTLQYRWERGAGGCTCTKKLLATDGCRGEKGILSFRGVDVGRLPVSGGWPHTHACVDSAGTLSTWISV